MGLFIAVLIILLIIFILFVPFLITLKFKNNKLTISIFNCEFNLNDFEHKPKKDKKVKKKKKNKKPNDSESFLTKSFYKWKDDLEGLFKYAKWLSTSIRKNLILKKLELNVFLGLSDAATTAISVGLGYAAVYNVLSFLDRLIMTILNDNVRVNISPEFNQQTVKVDLEAVIKTRVYLLLIIVIIIVMIFIKTLIFKKKTVDK